MAKPGLKRLLGRLIPIAFFVLIAVFAGIYLSKINWDAFGDLTFDPLWLIAALVASVAVRYWFAAIWMFLLRRLGAHLDGNRLELFVVYAKAWLGRYIPGGAAWILGKIYFASKLGISKTKLGVSSFLEGVLQIIVVLISASAMMAFDSRIQSFGSTWGFGLIAIAVVGLASVYPPIFNRVTTWVFRRVRKSEIDAASLPSNQTIGWGILAFAVSSVLSGLSFFFIAKAVVPELGWDQALFIIGASNLASALSMLAVFAPAGLGVREAVQIATLLLVMSPEQALVVTVLMRLFSILMDALFFALTAGTKAAQTIASARRKHKK